MKIKSLGREPFTKVASLLGLGALIAIGFQNCSQFKATSLSSSSLNMTNLSSFSYSGSPMSFQVLIDINQLHLDEALDPRFSDLTADGVWAVNIPNNPDLTTAQWTQVYKTLNYQKWLVSEDVYNDIFYHTTQPTYDFIAKPNQAMVYYENFLTNVNGPESSTVSYGSDENDSILLTTTDYLGAPVYINGVDKLTGVTSKVKVPVNQIQKVASAMAIDGKKPQIIVDSRTFGEGDTRQYHTKNALADPDCGGVSFEFSPTTAYAEFINLANGVKACLAAGKKCYVLIPPPGGVSGLVAAADMYHYKNNIQSVISFLAERNTLNNPNIYIVLATYVRGPQKVGFITGEDGTGDDNSVRAASLWLKALQVGHVDAEACMGTNGTGLKSWNGSQFGACQLVACNSGFRLNAATGTCDVAPVTPTTQAPPTSVTTTTQPPGGVTTTTQAPSGPETFSWNSASSSDVLWAASSAVDGNAGSCYSSAQFSSPANDRGTFLAAWLNGRNQGSYSVNGIDLTARMFSGRASGFPATYEISLTSPDNTSWVSVGQFSNQPDASGVVHINLGQTYKTWGIYIHPSTLTTDDANNYFFQLCEIGFR